MKQMQRASLWILWRLANAFHPVPQTKGVSFISLMQDCGLSKFKPEFEKWITRVTMEMLPLKFGAMYMVNEPFWFGNLAWPMLKGTIKPKMRERIVWLGSKKEKALKTYLEKSYGISDPSAAPADVVRCIPEDLGGTFKLVPGEWEKYLRATYPVTPNATQPSA